MRRLPRLLLYACASTVGAVILIYCGDSAVLRIRITAEKNPFGQVTVTPYYAVQLKNGDEQYYFQQPQVQDCTHSLFPHLSLQPCWYLERHREQRIDIGKPAGHTFYRREDFGGAPGERS